MTPKPGWIVYYDDNTHYPQYTVDGVENPYADIDRSKLSRFDFIADGRVIVSVPALSDRQFLYRKTTTMTNGVVVDIIYKVGYFVGKKTMELVYVRNNKIVELPDLKNNDIVLTKEEKKWQH